MVFIYYMLIIFYIIFVYIMYDTGGQQFLVFRKEDAEVYYKDKSDHLADEITDRIVNANRQKKSIRDYEGDH